MTAQVILYIILVVNQLLATAVFVALYLGRSRWRESTVGRHVLFWSAAAGILDVSWLLLLTWQQPWLIWLLFAGQGLVGLVTWQRVWLVWQAQHQDA